MISEIGIMIGFYIITRMISFGTRTGERKENIAVQIMAFITIAITVFILVDLLVRGMPDLSELSRL